MISSIPKWDFPAISQRSLRKLLQAVGRSLAEDSPLRLQPTEWFRADGWMECQWCSTFYAQHPDGEYPTFHILCDGQVIKA